MGITLNSECVVRCMHECADECALERVHKHEAKYLDWCEHTYCILGKKKALYGSPRKVFSFAFAMR